MKNKKIFDCENNWMMGQFEEKENGISPVLKMTIVTKYDDNTKSTGSDENTDWREWR